MRIGLDARFLTHPQFGGFKTYTRNLVEALAAIDRENEYIVYVDRLADSDAAPFRQANFTCRRVPGDVPIIGMPWREQIALRRHIGADRPDLVHFLCNTATIGLRTPHVITLHDRLQLERLAFPFPPGAAAARHWAMATYSRRAILPAIASARRVIAVSEHERDAISRELGIPRTRIAVTLEAPASDYRPLAGIELEQARHELPARLGVRPPFLVTVGSESRKQIPTAVRALAALGARHSDLSLVIVAAAADSHRAFRALAADLGVSDRVAVLGARRIDEMVGLYNLADAFVFPSVQEGFGLPPLEAMACGAPVIARRATSVPEIVGDAGVLVDSGEPSAWAAIIDHLRTTPRVREEMRQRGLHRARSFSWRRCAEQTLAVYREAAGSPPPVDAAS